MRAIALTVGGVDIVVSNAGIADAAPIDALPLSAWQRSLDINATGHFLVTRAAVRSMREQGIGGSVVLVCTKNTFDPAATSGLIARPSRPSCSWAACWQSRTVSMGYASIWSTQTQCSLIRACGVTISGRAAPQLTAWR